MSFAERYGPWAIIAGASEGTGAAFAKKLATLGVPSILVARRLEPLTALAKEIRDSTGVACVTASVDLSAADAPTKIIAAAGTREIGLYIANAGADVNGSRFLPNPIDAWLDHVRLNVLTTLQAVHHFAGPMQARGKGGIILVNSGACYGGGSYMSVYSASKAFVLNLGESLWAELSPKGVDVLNLVLSRTDTPAFRKLLAEKNMPLPDAWATPEEVAEVGLARLTKGPTYNWGQEDDVVGMAPTSAAMRRARLLTVDKSSKAVFGES